MNQRVTLSAGLSQYADWRDGIKRSISKYRDWLRTENLSDLHTHNQLEQILTTLNDDHLHVAFVAEFSRGKTELINTIFFGHLRQRVLPSGAGRTTMCPTELRYDPDSPPSVKLLPIATRAENTPLHDYRQQEDKWRKIKLNPDDPEQIANALAHLTDVLHVKPSDAEALDLPILEHNTNLSQAKPGTVEIPRWRHAIVNLPHPLLEQGLVILDTPGLNAIGAEPDLTINQIGSAHAVVFILGSDTGVTKSDLELWEEHIALKNPDANQKSRLAALNKIDTLWDELRQENDVRAEIESQANKTAEILKLPVENVFPVSAQKGLLGKVRGDTDLYAASRIARLEYAIAKSLIPAKLDIVRNRIDGALGNILDAGNALLEKRLSDADEHIAEMEQLRTKNSEVVNHIMSRAQAEKELLERNMQRFQSIRSIFTRQSNTLFSYLSLDTLHREIAATKLLMSNCLTTLTIQRCVNDFFVSVLRNMDQAIAQAEEITSLCTKVYKEFQEEHGLSQVTPRSLNLARYRQQILRLEHKHSDFKRTGKLFVREQMSITNRFYDTVGTVTKLIYMKAAKDAAEWSKTLMLPLETQIREHHGQLRRRVESVKRIHDAADTVEARLHELEMGKAHLSDQRDEMKKLSDQIRLHLYRTPELESVVKPMPPNVDSEFVAPARTPHPQVANDDSPAPELQTDSPHEMMSGVSLLK